MSQVFDLQDLLIDRRTLLKIARVFADEEGTCLLYSGKQYETASKSFLCLFPFDFVRIHGGKQKRHRIGDDAAISLSMENPWDALKVLLPDLGKGEHSFPEWVGFFGYEMGAYSDNEQKIPYFSAKTPEAYWQRCAVVLSIDHSTNKGRVCIADQAEYFFEDKWRHWVERLSDQRSWREMVAHADTFDLNEEKVNTIYQLVNLSETVESYISKIEKIQELIRAGDVYQINLSQRFEFLGKTNSFSLFTKLAMLNPAPFSAYLQLGEFSIVSSSPERFLSKSGNTLETRPIKGTAPRGNTPEEDKINRSSLMESSKEKAELLMITDLMRNDLGKVSCFGSIQTPLLCGCEPFTNVFHLNSIVRSEMQPHVHPLDAVRACFPGGSITGCPKLSAMQVIAELEQRPRGIYTGAIGYFASNGDFDLNIAIRTFVADAEGVSIQLGGGIVIDSDPQKEYEETLHKGQSIFKTLDVDMTPSAQLQEVK